ncbi:uncharacterized protein LOC121378289 [Gigantopelta aegis]|uniref:uncharacterized protein LOC121378289 n=1 Tax=Gigantopelta aegis TaxID=1735272 RepID=UPI001B889DAA|nr:uncharacterized protein LOC121378289 [Gigantopelta aegis]XP_041362338.1 uncharacterized protein LOC121378289 [Gigantopelta aegis]
MTSAAMLPSAVPFSQHKARIANTRCGMGFSYGTAVKNTVRHMVSNLENVITNLQGIVGDLHILVKQIDVVTNKMDTYNGTQWTRPSSTIHKKKTTKIAKKNNPVKQETKNENSVFNWQEMAETRAEQGPSPDIDWSYLSLTNNNSDDMKVRQTSSPKVTSRPPCMMRRIREPNPYLSSCGASSECDNDTDEGRVTKESKVRACCDFVLGSLEYETHSVETSNEDLNNPTPVVPVHVFCEEVVGSNTKGAYCGMYESAMESKLEILSECDEDDDDDDDDDDLSLNRQSDIEDDRPSIKSCDFKADYNRCVNPWTSFNLVHLDSSTHDSDDFVSDCASDILNENYIDSSSVNSGYENIVLTLPHHVCF